MAAPIQVCLFAFVAAVNSHNIPMNFLDDLLGEPPPVNVNQPRYPFNGYGLNQNNPNLFGPRGRFQIPNLGSRGLYDPRYLYNDTPFGPFVPRYPQYGATATPTFSQNQHNAHPRPENRDMDSSKTARQDRLPAPVTEIDEFDTKPEHTFIYTASNGRGIDVQNPKIDKGPLKVALLPESVTGTEEPVLKTNENKTSESKPTLPPMSTSSLETSPEEKLSTMPTEHTSELVNNATADNNVDKIVFPDQVNQIKEEMNGTLNNNNKTNNLNVLSNSSSNDVNISKSMDAVLVPVQMIPGQVSVINTGVNSNGNMLVPFTISKEQVGQVLPITNDIFPMRTTQITNSGNLPIQGTLYTNILNILSQDGAQQAVLMPIKVSDSNTNQNFGLNDNLSPNIVNQNVGVPSDIPQNPVIAMLLTPAKIQNVGSGSSNLVYNTLQQGNPVSAASIPNNVQYNQPGTQAFTDLQNGAQQIVPNSQLNAQNAQYYLVNGNTNIPVNGNSNNGQPYFLNLPGNLPSNNPNVLSTDAQKYMLVTVNNQQNLPQNPQGNIYALGNSNLNGAQPSPVSVNGNNGQSNIYALVTMPGVQNTGNNNLYVDNSASNPGYQVQGTQGYSLVSLKDDVHEKSTENR